MGFNSRVCRQIDLESDALRQWIEPMKEGFHYHRKLWEFCYIAQVLSERGVLVPGNRGLGFAVGLEPLPALFAKLGCRILGTDLGSDTVDPGWTSTGQHAASVAALNSRGICTEAEACERLEFQFVDMNRVPDDLKGFDFLWSSCAIEHVGSLELSKRAVLNMMKCLKPGGVAVHTTEYNVLSDGATVTEGNSIIWRRRDLVELGESLRAAGHTLAPLELESGNLFADYYVDEQPYKSHPHLKLRLFEYVATSVGIVITAGQ